MNLITSQPKPEVVEKNERSIKFRVSRSGMLTNLPKNNQKLASCISTKNVRDNQSMLSAVSKNLIVVSRANQQHKQALAKSVVMGAVSKENSKLDPSKFSPFNDFGSLDTESSERKPYEPKSQDNLPSEDAFGSCGDSRCQDLLPKLKPSKSLAKLTIVSESTQARSSRGVSKDAKSLFSGNYRTPVVAPRKENRFWLRNDKVSLPKLDLKQTPSAFLRLNVHQLG